MKAYHIYLEDKCLFKNLNEEEFKVIWDKNFELLGGSVGDAAFCEQRTQGRGTKACKLLLAQTFRLPNPQVALQLLCHCAGFAKMVFSARVVPPS